MVMNNPDYRLQKPYADYLYAHTPTEPKDQNFIVTTIKTIEHRTVNLSFEKESYSHRASSTLNVRRDKVSDRLPKAKSG